MAKELEKRIEALEEKNKKVELDKAWETSLLRKLAVSVLTYFVIAVFMLFSDIDRPFLSALVPTAGFILSTLTLSRLKTWWINTKS